VTVAVLAVGWAVLAAAPIARRARRLPARERTRVLAPPRAVTSPSSSSGWTARVLAHVPGALRHVIAGLRARRAARRIDDVIVRELPITVDLLAVAVGAGCTPFLAVDTASRWAPPMLSTALDGVRRACTLGRGFGDALDDLARSIPQLEPLAEALQASDRFGAPVGDALHRLAGEQRKALRRRAETRARTVPVRLLFPLVFLVLPAFALLTVVPAVFSGLGGI
jgi:tight adherence protein C